MLKYFVLIGDIAKLCTSSLEYIGYATFHFTNTNCLDWSLGKEHPLILRTAPNFPLGIFKILFTMVTLYWLPASMLAYKNLYHWNHQKLFILGVKLMPIETVFSHLYLMFYLWKYF